MGFTILPHAFCCLRCHQDSICIIKRRTAGEAASLKIFASIGDLQDHFSQIFISESIFTVNKGSFFIPDFRERFAISTAALFLVALKEPFCHLLIRFQPESLLFAAFEHNLQLISDKEAGKAKTAKKDIYDDMSTPSVSSDWYFYDVFSYPSVLNIIDRYFPLLYS